MKGRLKEEETERKELKKCPKIYITGIRSPVFFMYTNTVLQKKKACREASNHL